MFVTTMINNNNFTSEARAFILDLPEFQFGDEGYTYTITQDICRVLNGCTNVDAAFAERVRKVFPNPSIVTLEDIITKHEYDINFHTNDPTEAKQYLEQELFTDYKRMYPWNTIIGDREQFTLDMLENGSWTHQTVQEIWYMLQNEGDYFVFIDDIIELKEICEKHPEWNIKLEVVWGEIVKDYKNLYEYYRKLISSGLATHDQIMKEFSKSFGGKNDKEMLSVLLSSIPLPQHILHTYVVPDFIRANDVDDAISFLYTLPNINVQHVVDAITYDWEENIDILVRIKNAIPNHPEWGSLNVQIDSFYINGANVQETEKNIKTLREVDLIEKDYLSFLVSRNLHYNMNDDLDSVFSHLADVRWMSRRNPDWIVDWSAGGIDMMDTALVERLVIEGYWSTALLQEQVDKISDVEELRMVRDLLAKHREWNVKINLNDPELAFELGLDFTHVEQSPQNAAEAVALVERFRTIGSKL